MMTKYETMNNQQFQQSSQQQQQLSTSHRQMVGRRVVDRSIGFFSTNATATTTSLLQRQQRQPPVASQLQGRRRRVAPARVSPPTYIAHRTFQPVGATELLVFRQYLNFFSFLSTFLNHRFIVDREIHTIQLKYCH